MIQPRASLVDSLQLYVESAHISSFSGAGHLFCLLIH